MKLNMLRVCVPVLMLMVFRSGVCHSGETEEALMRLFGLSQQSRVMPVAQQPVLAEETLSRIQELRNLGGDPSILEGFANGAQSQEQARQCRTAINRADEEIARLRREAEQRRQQEEARAKQEAEKRRQEEEARAKQEEELNRQREEVRAQQAEEVRLRMQELEDLGGDKSMLSRFENGSGNPEELREYKATLNRADAEIIRLRNEGNLNNQSAIDQLTEENQELRGMIEQLMEEVKNLKMEGLKQKEEA